VSYFEQNGYKLFYKEYGEGKPLLIIHGNTASSIMLDEEIKFYSNNFKVITVDIIGHGKSERLEKFPANFWEENAKLLNGLCKKLNINKINIIGTSGGAIIALNFAIHYSENVNRVIADSFMGEKFSVKEAKAIKTKREEAKSKGADQFWYYMHGKDWEKVVDADTKMLIEFAHKYENNFHNNLKKIDCPVLITGSLSDNTIGKIEEKLCNVAKKIKSSTTLFSPQGEHPLMLSNNDFFRKVALNFLKEDTLILENSK